MNTCSPKVSYLFEKAHFQLRGSDLWSFTYLNLQGEFLLETLDLRAGCGVFVLDCKGVSRSTLPLSGLSSLELCFSGHFLQLPQGLREVHTQRLSSIALDSFLLS